MEGYIDSFFRNFLLLEEQGNEHYYSLYFKEAILSFLKNSNKKKAMDIFELFFDYFKLKASEGNNFVDLLDVLKNYEKNAAILIDKQRDHFIHSVNVFILGLSIYAENKNFRDAYLYYKKDEFKTNDVKLKEVFFCEWGMAALCHDIGYPIEIISKQLKKFSDIITKAIITGDEAKPYIGFHNFSAIDSFFSKEATKTPIELLSNCIGGFLNLNIEELQKWLEKYPETMKKNGLIDHGYYSAITILKWYEFLMNDEQDKEKQLESVINASSAVLLHNYYKNYLMKKPFSLKLLQVKTHPLSYLLILCDELQDWNREAYGIEDKKKVKIDDSRIKISDNLLEVTYLMFDGKIEETYREKKIDSIVKILDIYSLFKLGFVVDTMHLSDLYIEEIQINEKDIQPRLLIENIERLAKLIHDDYNKKQLLKNPNQKLSYPTWESLPETLKYSNLRQAKQMTEKIRFLGYIVVNDKLSLESVEALTVKEIEYLAEKEHYSWMEERIKNGWKYGKEKNIDAKESPYLVSYNELSEDIKELDRDAIKNIITLLNLIGLNVYKQ